MIYSTLNTIVATLVPFTGINFVTNFIDRDIVVITVITENKLTIINVYASSLEDLEPILEKLQALYNNLSSNELLIAGDFNARSPVWGDQTEDCRGEKLLEFCSANNLFISNNENSIPTFQATQGHSWVDLTIVQFKEDSKLNDWKVRKDETLSDHQEIEYGYAERASTDIPSLRRYRIKEIN